MEKQKKSKKQEKHRDGSQDPMKATGDSKGAQGAVLVDVPAGHVIGMDFAKNMKSAAVELKRMSLTKDQVPDLNQARQKPPASPRAPEMREAMPQNSLMPKSSFEALDHPVHVQKPLQMQQFDSQQQRPPPSPKPEHHAHQQLGQQFESRGQMQGHSGYPSRMENVHSGPSLKGQVQTQVTSAPSLPQANGNVGRGQSAAKNTSPYQDIGSMLDGMTCPSCGNIKGMERLDLCQLRDAAEELRAHLADLSLQFAQEQTREAAECRRLRGLLENDPRYKAEFKESQRQQGGNAEVRELRSEMESMKRQFRAQVDDLRQQLSAEEKQSRELREKLQHQEMRRGR